MAISQSSAPTTVVGGRYELGDELGRGGMAEVRAGTDMRLQRPVAVKFLLPAMAARDDIRRRFEAEARNAASLSDPRAVAVYDTGEHDGIPYMVMERLPGETLADRIREGPVDQASVRQIASEVLGALAAAHAAGIVHRDVKPGNILLTADGHAKIADFGIAKSLEAASPDLTGTGQLLGTPAYLGPERLEGAPATVRSDLYSLGVVLYEALAGRCPFAGDTPIAAARAVAEGDYVPVREAVPDVDPALAATVERAMARDPEARFPSAGAMAAALAAAPTVVDAGAPTLITAAPATSVFDVDALAAAPVPGPRVTGAPAAAAPVGAARLRRPPLAALGRRVPLALLAALAVVALLVAVLHHRSGPSTPQPVSSQSPRTTLAVTTVPTTSAATSAVTVPAQTAVTSGTSATSSAGTTATVAGNAGTTAKKAPKDDGKGKGKG